MTKPTTGWLDRITRWLVDRVGIQHRADQRQRIIRAVQERMRALGIGSGDAYWRLLAYDPGEQQALINLVTITETCFYRHPRLFAALTEAILPALHRELPLAAPLRVWSAATATGEEAYTLAMTAAVSGVLPTRPVLILGTDINSLALRAALRAEYPERAARRLPPQWRQRFLRPTRPGYVTVTPEVRAPVRFAQFNLRDLARRAGPPMVADLVVCANVLIYFEEDVVLRILRRLQETMPPHGVIYVDEVLGHLAREVLHPVRFGDVIVYRPHRAERRPRAKRRGPVQARPPTEERATALPAQPQVMAPQEVTELLREGKVDEAEQRLRRRLETHPLDAVAYFLLGRVYTAQGRWEEARVAFERAIYLAPTLAAAYLELGNLWQQVGHRQRAVKMYRWTLQTLERDVLSVRLGYPRELLRSAAQRGLAALQRSSTK